MPEVKWVAFERDQKLEKLELALSLLDAILEGDLEAVHEQAWEHGYGWKR